MTEWKGSAFHPSLKNGRSECILIIREKSLVARTPQGSELVMDIDDCEFRLQGDANKTLAFISRKTDRFTLTTTDSSLLEELKRFSGFVETLNRFHTSRRKSWVKKIVVPLVILIFLFVVLPILFFGPVLDLAVGALPVSIDIQLGELAADSAIRELTGQAPNEKVNEQVRSVVDTIMNRLLVAVPDQGFRFKVHIVSSDILNAFALPGGQIIVTTRLLRKAGSAEQVAGVLAHEISHVTNRHGLRGVAKGLSFWILLGAVFGDVGAIGGAILAQAANLVSLGFSRDMEREADRQGILLLKSARVDVNGLGNFLQKLMEHEKTKPHHGVAIFQTHPVTEERLENIKAQIKEIGHGNPERINVDWVSLQNALR